MKNRLIIHLLPDEREALQRMSEQDVRPPDAQIRFLLVSEAVRRGFLTGSTNSKSAESYQGQGAFAGINQ